MHTTLKLCILVKHLHRSAFFVATVMLPVSLKTGIETAIFIRLQPHSPFFQVDAERSRDLQSVLLLLFLRDVASVLTCCPTAPVKLPRGPKRQDETVQPHKLLDDVQVVTFFYWIFFFYFLSKVASLFIYFTFSPSTRPHLLPWWKVLTFHSFFISNLTKLEYWFIVVRLQEPWFPADVTAVFLNPSPKQNLRLEVDHVSQDRRGSDGVEQKWVHRMTNMFSHLPLEWFCGSVVQIPTLLLWLFISLGQKSEQCQLLTLSTSNLPPFKKKNLFMWLLSLFFFFFFNDSAEFKWFWQPFIFQHSSTASVPHGFQSSPVFLPSVCLLLYSVLNGEFKLRIRLLFFSNVFTVTLTRSMKSSKSATSHCLRLTQMVKLLVFQQWYLSLFTIDFQPTFSNYSKFSQTILSFCSLMGQFSTFMNNVCN